MKNTLTFTIAAVLLFGSALGCKNNLVSKLTRAKSKCAANLPELQTAKEYVSRGGYAIVEGNYECALDDCEKALEMGEKTAEAHVCRGYALLKREEFDAAESDFNVAIELAPDNALTFYQRSHFYRETKQFGKALTDINKSIEMMPAHYQYEYRAEIYTDLTDYENAIKDYTEAIRLKPEAQHYYSERAEIYRRLGKNDLAAADERKYEEMRAAEDVAENAEKEARKTTQEKIAETILNAEAVSIPKPIYPPAAKAVRASGEVKVEIAVDAQGNVSSAKAVSGNPFLRAASEQAARQAKFKPLPINGVLVFNFQVPNQLGD